MVGMRWCDLPSDLLYEIDAELVYIEKVIIRATCVWWNSALPKMPDLKSPQLPWLFHTNVDTEGRKSQALFNICEEKDYKLRYFPQLEGKLLRGSTHGWLATISLDDDETAPNSPDICLFNPLTGVQIQLPPRSTFPDVKEYYTDRVGLEYCVEDGDDPEDRYLDDNSYHVHLHLTRQIVISSPCIENCVVAALYGGAAQLAWCKPGHEKWTHVDIHSGKTFTASLEDIIFSNEKLYVLTSRGHLMEVEFRGDLDPKTTVIVGQPTEKVHCGHQKFVVACSDHKVKLVIRHFNNDFAVYELDLENPCWCLTHNIKNEMLFLGYNQSLSVLACQFPRYNGNRIYFADDQSLTLDNDRKGDALIAVYNMEDGIRQNLSGFPNVSRSLLPQQIWITPPVYV